MDWDIKKHIYLHNMSWCGFFVGAFWILHDFFGPKKSRSRRKRSASKRRTFQGPGVTGVMTVEVAGMRIWNCGMACDSCCFRASGTGIPAAISNQAVPMGLKAPMKGFLVSMKWCRFPNPERALATLLHLIWASPPCWKCWQMEWLLQVPHPGCSSSPTSGQHKPWNDGMPKCSAARTLVITWNHEMK